MSKFKDKAPSTLDVAFKNWAIPQLRVIFFAGHDSSAATLCYLFYLLSQNSASMDKLRAEHDNVFGNDFSAASELIRAWPQLLNKLPFTNAVIKEVLRLFPPASAARFGRPCSDIVGDDGRRYPTGDNFLWVLHSALHRNPKSWKDPSAFIPECYLLGPEDLLYPVKGAYRPFEHGPRDCIGQALAMSKLKISLVMLVRTFDVIPAYDDWDQVHGIPKLRTCKFQGERAYQIRSGWCASGRWCSVPHHGARVRNDSVTTRSAAAGGFPDTETRSTCVRVYSQAPRLMYANHSFLELREECDVAERYVAPAEE